MQIISLITQFSPALYQFLPLRLKELLCLPYKVMQNRTVFISGPFYATDVVLHNCIVSHVTFFISLSFHYMSCEHV